MHVGEPAGVAVPAWHCAQAAAEVETVDVPGLQAVQVVAPAAAE
jgi:hypothetical protein